MSMYLKTQVSRLLRLVGFAHQKRISKMRVSHMKEWFLAKGYPEIVVNNQIDKVVFGRDKSVKKNLESDIPFVTNYHHKVKELGKMIWNLLPFLYSDGEVQKVFSPSPIVTYRSAKKIKYYIARSKLYPVERNVKCRGCGSSRCQVCKSISITEELLASPLKEPIK